MTLKAEVPCRTKMSNVDIDAMNVERDIGEEEVNREWMLEQMRYDEASRRSEGSPERKVRYW
jgi:hypothetical protein